MEFTGKYNWQHNHPETFDERKRKWNSSAQSKKRKTVRKKVSEKKEDENGDPVGEKVDDKILEEKKMETEKIEQGAKKTRKRRQPLSCLT